MTLGKRAYTRILLTLVAGVAAYDLLLWGLALAGPRTWHHLAIGAALAAAGCVAWEPVARRVERDGVIQPLAWIAFPAAMLFGIAAVPFLAFSAYPALEGLVFRVEARIVAPGGDLEVSFPRPMEPWNVNLRIGPNPVAAAHLTGATPLVSWPSSQVLRIRLDELLDAEGWRPPGWIEINTVGELAPMRYEGGDPVPQQRVPLR